MCFEACCTIFLLLFDLDNASAFIHSDNNNVATPNQSPQHPVTGGSKQLDVVRLDNHMLDCDEDGNERYVVSIFQTEGREKNQTNVAFALEWYWTELLNDDAFVVL